MHRSVDIKLVLFILFVLLLLALYRPTLGFLKPFIDVVLEKGRERYTRYTIRGS